MQDEIPSPRDSGIQYAQNSGSRARFLFLQPRIMHLTRGLLMRVTFLSHYNYILPYPRRKECSPKLLENN